MSHRQTISFLTKRFAEIGLRPDSRHGQNFLIDLNLLELLANSADIEERDVVLEVGTGTGSLTSLLAQRAAAVVTVEIDRHLHQLAQEELAEHTNITFLHQDALKNKNRLHANVLETVKSQLAAGPGRRFKLAANLPYNIATPIVSNLLSTELIPDAMTVTIQKELAERMTARPRTKDYSALSVWIQCQCETQIVRIMPPGVFWPRPKVESAILRIIPSAAMRETIPNRAFFHQFVRALFFHRRKFLRSVLVSACKGKLDKPAVDRILQSMELGPTARAEELPIATMIALSERVREQLGDWEPGADGTL